MGDKWRNIAPIVVLVALTSVVRADERRVVAKTVIGAQRAGIVHYDLKTYLKSWTDDAKIIGGRSESPGPYDFVIHRKQIESSRRMLYQGKPVITKLDFEVDEVSVEDGFAELKVQVTSHYDGGRTRIGEIYRLRKTAKGWKVFENRWWLLERNIGERTVVYDSKKLRRADAAVERERRSRNLKNHIFALYDASRFAEAFDVAKVLTKAKEATADDWLIRGNLAMQVGNAEDAKASFLKAISLDKDVELPPYAVGLKKKQE